MKRILPVVLVFLVTGVGVFLLLDSGLLEEGVGVPTESGERSERLPDGPISRVAAIDKLRKKAGGDSPLEDLLVELTSLNIRALERMFEVVEEPGKCQHILAKALRRLERDEPQILELLERIKDSPQRLSTEPASAEKKRAMARLQKHIQSFKARQKRGHTALREFRSRCPKQASTLMSNMVEFKNRMSTIIQRQIPAAGQTGDDPPF